jgi:hypothetical protein
MGEPHKRTAAPGTGDGSEGNDAGSVKSLRDTQADSKNQLLTELAAARRHLKNRTHNLEGICAWRDELRVRLARSQLRMELIGLSDEEQQRLVEEIDDYRRCCRALNWSPSGRGR